MSEKVLALMVTHNREHLLAECLDSLVAQDRPPDHVLVVDNASTDGTSALLEERQGGYFSEILHHAKVALGTAGTANEQAAGLGVPTPGPQFTLGFAQRQRRLLGPALTLAKPEPTEIAQAVRAVLEEERYRLASAAGKERIGTPGALPRIAEEIQEVLDG
jgi:uncharacterized protein (TIGR03492 family)